MPFQNVGTLLENLVVVEAAMTLLEVCGDRPGPLEFCSGFAMPPLSPWQRHSQNTGFDDKVFARFRTSDLLATEFGYPTLLRACMSFEPAAGPNAALLVSGTLSHHGRSCRMWLNDLREGRYGDAISKLEQLPGIATSIFGRGENTSPAPHPQLSDLPYPESIPDLARVLGIWRAATPAAARLAFLDPMSYRIQERDDDQTSSEDHRRWLKLLHLEQPTLALHFTANRTHRALERELASLHEDAISQGYAATRAFKRQHYVLFVAAHAGSQADDEQLAAMTERRVRFAWQSWFVSFVGRHNTALTIYRNGTRLDA